MPHLDHTAFVNSRRDERSLGHHTLRAYAQDLRTFVRFTRAHQLSDPLSKDDLCAGFEPCAATGVGGSGYSGRIEKLRAENQLSLRCARMSV